MLNYLTAYHILNVFGLSLYPVYRYKNADVIESSPYNNREYQILITVFLISLVKFFRSICWEEWIHNLFIYGKTASVLLFLFQDYRLGIWYVIFCLLVWIFLKIPHYNGPSKIQEVYNEDFETIDAQIKIKLLLFYADWSDACLFVIYLNINRLKEYGLTYQ